MALQLAAIGAEPGTVSLPASPWLATILLPHPEEATGLTLGEEQFDLALTPGQPTWLRFTASRTGPVFVQCLAEGGGVPHLLLVDALGLPVRAQADRFPNRRFIWAHCRPGASYYLAVVPSTAGMVAQVVVADATFLAQGLDPISVSGDPLDLGIRYAHADPCYRFVSLPALRRYSMAVDVGPRPVDVLLAGLDGEVVCERFAATGLVEAVVACASEEPHLLLLAPLFPPVDQGSAHIHFEPLESQNGVLAIRAAEPKTVELPRVGAKRTAVCALRPGLWTVELTGDQFTDHLRLSCRLSGAAQGATLAKSPGQTSVSRTLLSTEPRPLLLSVTHVSGPGRAHCSLSVKPQPLPSAATAAPKADALGWTVSPLAAASVYRVEPPAAVDWEELLFCEPGNGSLHRAHGLPLLDGDLILRPIEDGALAVRIPASRHGRATVRQLAAPMPEALPGVPERAASLAADGTPVDVVFTQDCQEAWLRLDAEAGTRYEVVSSDQLACDVDLVILPVDGTLPVWSDGEGIDPPVYRGYRRLDWVCPGAGPYLLRVVPHAPISGSVACVKLSARVAATGLPAARQCSLADTPATATPAALDIPLVGALEPWHAGYLKVVPPADGELTVVPEHTAFVNTAVRFVDEAGDPVGPDAYASGQPANVAPVQVEAEAEVYVELVNWSDHTGYFQIHLHVTDNPLP